MIVNHWDFLKLFNIRILAKYITLVAQISMTTRVFICKFFSSQHGLIKDHTLINFWEQIPPTWVSLILKWENSYFLPLQEVFLDCRANFNILIDTPLILHYIVAARFKKRIWPHAYSGPHIYWFCKNCPPTMLIQDHTVIQATRVPH